MNNPDIQASKNEQSRDTGNEEWTIQRYRQPRMNNPEIQATENDQSRDTGIQEGTIQSYRQRRMNNPEIQAILGTKHRKNTYKTKKMSNTDYTETLGWTYELAKDKQFQFHIKHPQWYSYSSFRYKSCRW